MEKFKIYVHHYYTYELFWLYFHGVEIEPKDVPVFFKKNQYNKRLKIEQDVILKGIYKGNEIKIVFCNNNHWECEDGFHLFDYSIHLLEIGLVSDRGFNSEIMQSVRRKMFPMLNKHSFVHKNKLHFIYIDWEGHDPFDEDYIYRKLNPNIQVFVDEKECVIPDVQLRIKNNHFVFTNIIWSFIYPNTLGVREYYFFHDYLKYKNDYKYKINLPIRAFFDYKERMACEIMKLNNPHISITNSSFHDKQQYGSALQNISPLRKEVIKKMPKENYIEKRGYGIHDWGGEWNDNNMNENMWKMFGISEVVILPENRRKITEKSVSHILLGKPFIPINKEVIEYYDIYLKKYNKPIVEFPIDYKKGDLFQYLEYLDEITKNDEMWNEFKDKLTKYVLNLRTHLIDIIHENNSYLDYVVNHEPREEIKWHLPLI